MTSPQDATEYAIIYGSPLLAYAQFASGIEQYLGGFATNTFYHAKDLSTADDVNFVRQNVDTLYSEALVDLSTQDIIVTIPEVPNGRFYVFPFYDVYGNNFLNLGTAGISKAPGRYLVSYRPADPGYGTGDDSYAGYVYMPTPYGIILNRIQCNGPDDVATVNALQVQFTLMSRPIPVQLAPRLTKALLFDGFSTDDTVKLLELTARFSLFCLPEVASSIPTVNSVLRIAGLSGGSYSTPDGVDLTQAMTDATTAISAVGNPADPQFATYFRDLGNSWSQVRDIYSGDFKDNYSIRAYIANQGYLQLKADQAIYPSYLSAPLTSDNSYTVTFSGKPPVSGFWSLTVYDGQGYLIKGSNVYTLGDRSPIEYPDGNLVYPTSGSSDEGEFSILLQALNIPPPEQYQPNWIPTPATDEGNTAPPFQFTLRWYGPTLGLLDGSYVYPTVVASAPITKA